MAGNPYSLFVHNADGMNSDTASGNGSDTTVYTVSNGSPVLLIGTGSPLLGIEEGDGGVNFIGYIADRGSDGIPASKWTFELDTVSFALENGTPLG